MEEKYILYMDNLQRTILAEIMEEKTDLLTIKNPLILHIETDGPKINVKFYQIMFREFLADKDSPTIWEISPKNISRCKDVVLDARLISQYKHIFSPIKNIQNMGPTQQPVEQIATPSNSVIKLFDDDEI